VTTRSISTAGSIRLAKAMWWMLARMAGWDGSTTKGSSVAAADGAKVTIENSEQDILPEPEFLIYPNPTEGVFTIQSDFTEEETYTINLITTSGQIILNKKLNAIGGKCLLDISDLSNGYYTLKILTSRAVKYCKVIKQ
jgi:hypothetical protein